MVSQSKCRVSVVVPTYKRPEMLTRCLMALMAQDFEATAYEVIIADDAVCDETRREVEAWARRIHEESRTVRYVPVEGQHGPAAARNAGWRAASGEIIAFTDDDCVPMPGWLSAGVAAFSDHVIGVTGQLIVPMPSDRCPTDYERNAAQLATSRFVTANCFYRRLHLAAVGGFDERFTAAWREDSDLLFTLLHLLPNHKHRVGALVAVRHPASSHRHRVGALVAARGPMPAPTTEFPTHGYHNGPRPPSLRNPHHSIFSTSHQTPTLARIANGGPCGYPPNIEEAFVYAADAVVVHPLRPAPWGISLTQQRKSMFNALLYKKHRDLYREKIQATPPWHYYAIVGALLAAIQGLWNRDVRLVLGATGLWLWLTGRFCARRLHGTSHEPGHVAEMVVTSALIPPLAVFWRIWGAIKFRVFFL